MTKRHRPLVSLVVLSLALLLPPFTAAAPAGGQKSPFRRATRPGSTKRSFI